MDAKQLCLHAGDFIQAVRDGDKEDVEAFFYRLASAWDDYAASLMQKASAES